MIELSGTSIFMIGFFCGGYAMFTIIGMLYVCKKEGIVGPEK